MFRFWEKHASFLAKTCSVFGEHMPHFWEEQAPSLGRFGEKPARFGGNWFAFGLGLGLKSHCFEHKACFGLDFLSFYDWVSLKKSTGGKLGG